MNEAVTQTIKNILTFNVHSWLEADQITKLNQLADFIAEKKIEVITLQEVNQLIEGSVVSLDSYYIPSDEQQVPIKEDNFALLLVKALQKRGHRYYWSWLENHIGYDQYDEGLAILSKYPFEAEGSRISYYKDYSNYQTRRLLKATIVPKLSVVCAHFSWWQAANDAGFQYEWQQTLDWLEEITTPLIVAGDFNAPAGLESHQLLLANPLELKDSYETSLKRIGEATAPPVIDGWRGRQLPEVMRIDYVWHSKNLTPSLHQVVFDGTSMDQLSDHYGIYIEFE